MSLTPSQDRGLALRRSRRHDAPPAPLMSPAIGEHAVTEVIPRLERDLAQARDALADMADVAVAALRALRDEQHAHVETRRLLDIARANVAAIDPGGETTTGGW